MLIWLLVNTITIVQDYSNVKHTHKQAHSHAGLRHSVRTAWSAVRAERCQVALGHQFGWEVRPIADHSPWTSAHWSGRLQSRAGSACSWPGSQWYPRWAPQSPETAAYPPESKQRGFNMKTCCNLKKKKKEKRLALIISFVLFIFTSSITIIWTLSTLATPFFIKSRILPGVAMTTCTDKEAERSTFRLKIQSVKTKWCFYEMYWGLLKSLSGRDRMHGRSKVKIIFLSLETTETDRFTDIHISVFFDWQQCAHVFPL